MAKEKTIETRNEAVEAIDNLICQQQAKLSAMANDPNIGIKSDQYRNGMQDLAKLCEAREKLANSETNYLKDGKTHKLRVNPNTVIAGLFGLGQIGLLAYMEREHVLPKCVGRVLDSCKEIFKKGE
jgi:hypothetical protein